MRTARARLAVVLVLGAAMLSSAAAAQGGGSVAQQVTDRVARWVDTVNDGDDAAFAALHASDALARHTGGFVDAGVDAIATWARELSAGGLRVALDDVVAGALSDELAYARARFTTVDAAGDVRSAGVWYAVLRDGADGWRFYRTHDVARPAPTD